MLLYSSINLLVNHRYCSCKAKTNILIFLNFGYHELKHMKRNSDTYKQMIIEENLSMFYPKTFAMKNASQLPMRHYKYIKKTE